MRVTLSIFQLYCQISLFEFQTFELAILTHIQLDDIINSLRNSGGKVFTVLLTLHAYKDNNKSFEAT